VQVSLQQFYIEIMQGDDAEATKTKTKMKKEKAPMKESAKKRWKRME